MTVTDNAARSTRFPGDDDRNYFMLIDGEPASASDGGTFSCLDPYENAAWVRVPAATATDVDRAVTAARRAFDNGWSTSSPFERAALLRHLGDLIEQHAEELARIQIHEDFSYLPDGDPGRDISADPGL